MIYEEVCYTYIDVDITYYKSLSTDRIIRAINDAVTDYKHWLSIPVMVTPFVSKWLVWSTVLLDAGTYYSVSC